MNRVWTFGDSFTFGHGCRPEGPNSEYYYKYKTESDAVWPDLFGEMLGMEVKNFGKCGASNDFIIDSVIENWDNFRERDYVIIGITYHNRFDVPLRDPHSLKQKLTSIFWDWDKFVFDDIRSQYTLEERKCIINFQYYFSNNELYKIRYLKRLNFLNKLLKERNINSFLWDVDFYQHTSRFEKIADATNGEIEDYHFSFKGHKDFANILYKKIVSQNLI